MIPTLGRIVHYTTFANKEDECPTVVQAAIITFVKPYDQFHLGQDSPDSEENKYRVSLHVFRKQDFIVGSSDLPQAPWSEEPKPGHWNWPPRM